VIIDEAKQRREFTRWVLILALYNARPYGAQEEVLLSTLQGVYADCTKLEMRRELDYVAVRGLVDVTKHPDGHWSAKLNHHGHDFAEYSIDALPGIARPPKLG